MTRNLTVDEEIFLNQFTQKIHSLDVMNRWFEKYDLSNKRDILSNLFNIVLQSHPTYEDIESSIKSLDKFKTPSAMILLNKNNPFSKFGYKIVELPEKELLNGFDILLETLSIADNRRRASENPAKCHHWWHKDLTNQKYLDYLRRKSKTGDGSLS